MNYTETARKAAKWALSKIGCAYSQANRTKADIFDCSSLVARAYTAQGKKWIWGGSVPTSMNLVYDDEFELLWPATYASIGKSFGASAVVNLINTEGDLQFLRTDSTTTRANKITHVAMAAGGNKLVHARGAGYGVRTDPIALYSGKICAVTRYNPFCALRSGMKGNRTKALQKELNARGASLAGDGEFGPKTLAAVKDIQKKLNLTGDGVAGEKTLMALGLLPLPEADKPVEQAPPAESGVRVTGGTVHIRTGPGANYPSVKIAKKGEVYQEIDTARWQIISLNGEARFISKKYVEKV